VNVGVKEKTRQNGAGLPEFAKLQRHNYYGTNGKHFGVFKALKGTINFNNKLHYITYLTYGLALNTSIVFGTKQAFKYNISVIN